MNSNQPLHDHLTAMEFYARLDGRHVSIEGVIAEAKLRPGADGRTGFQELYAAKPQMPAFLALKYVPCARPPASSPS